MKLFFSVLCLVVFFFSVDGLKVLGVLPFGSNSHYVIGSSILKSLHKAGHEITVISPYPQKKVMDKWRDISTFDILKKQLEENSLNGFELGNKHPFVIMMFLYKLGSDLVKSYMNHPGVNSFLEEDQHFDVCVNEVFNADAFLGIAEKYGCVVISYTTFAAVKWINDMTSNPAPPSYVPHPYLHYTENMTFLERLHNTVGFLWEDFIYSFIHLPNQRRLYNKYFPNAKRSFDEMYKNSAIIFMNNHVSSSSARPYLPNMIEIGGIHVEPAKPLPKDIQDFLDSAEDGVILFSMGSIIQAVQWPEEKREAFVKAFGKLKQKVLWKYENETLPNKPSNVMINKWIPQRDILAHPNVMLFITHGGLLGTTEALVEGVPVLGIPMFGDQKMNMAKTVARDYGLQVFYEDITEEALTSKLSEILGNQKYRESAKLISSQFTDRPITPQESVVYWTEYAVRQKGAPHLRAAGNSLNFIEFHLFDVYSVIIMIVLIILFIFVKITKACLRKVFIKDSKQKIKKK